MDEPKAVETSREAEPIIIGTTDNIPGLVTLAKLLLATRSTFKRWQQAYGPLHSAFELGRQARLSPEAIQAVNEELADLRRRWNAAEAKVSPDAIERAADRIFGVSVEAEHNRGPEWSIEVISAMLREELGVKI